MNATKGDNINNGILVLNNIIEGFKDKSLHIEKVFKGEGVINNLNPLFNNEDEYFLFRERFVYLSGFIEFQLFQEEYLKKAIEELRFYFFNSDFRYEIIDIGNSLFSIKVSTIIRNEIKPLLQLNPFFKKIVLLENDSLTKLESLINQYTIQLEILKKEELSVGNSIQNPIMSSDNPIEMLNSTFRKKKKVKSLKERAFDLNTEIMNTERLIREYTNYIYDTQSSEITLIDDKNLIITKLKRDFSYIVENGNEYELNDSIDHNFALSQKLEDDEKVNNSLRELNKKFKE